jgi:type III restriction enzyme
VRREDWLPGFEQDVHINVFNISKINSEVRSGKAPRIKRLSEYIGRSYFDYLAELNDLVMLMDESHRYRATAGIRAINELMPVLGLELTATPQVERGTTSIPFKNVIYNQPIVKPFMLVVAQDTEHANALQHRIESSDFFEGRYLGKVITVHSNVRGEEKDEVVQQLLTVEQPDNPIEIVIHVNMLKEGWDVTNLYTIVPLRAANSRTLVEQSIGRGLRLPYGKRVGIPAVDRLTIVSHDLI